MSYRKCDERLGRMLDRFNPDTPVFLYFKGGTALPKLGTVVWSRIWFPFWKRFMLAWRN